MEYRKYTIMDNYNSAYDGFKLNILKYNECLGRTKIVAKANSEEEAKKIIDKLEENA